MRSLPAVTGLVAASLLAGCAPPPSPRDPQLPVLQATDASTAATVARAPAPARIDVRCPVGIEQPGLVLARVGAVVLTACDLAVARERETRAGAQVDDPRPLLDALVRETLLASRVEASPRDPAIDHELVEALVRTEALSALAPTCPDASAIERYYRDHLPLFTLPERVHLREIVLRDRRAADRVQQALARGTAFEDLVDHTITPTGRRDAGDLGLVPREGNDVVPSAIAAAGFAILEPGGLAPAPLRVVTGIPTRRHRVRRVAAWHVVQLLERLPEERVPLETARREIVQRLTRDRYATLRRQARERLAEQLQAQVQAAIDPAALAQVQVHLPARPARRHR